LQTEGNRIPDGHAGLHAYCLHFAALGDDASSLVAEDADGLALQEVIAHPFGADVEAIGVEMTVGDGRGHVCARLLLAPPLGMVRVPFFCMNLRTVISGLLRNL
jgi:hypothetical protein